LELFLPLLFVSFFCGTDSVSVDCTCPQFVTIVSLNHCDLLFKLSDTDIAPSSTGLLQSPRKMTQILLSGGFLSLRNHLPVSVSRRIAHNISIFECPPRLHSVAVFFLSLFVSISSSRIFAFVFPSLFITYMLVSPPLCSVQDYPSVFCTSVVVFAPSKVK
jgi:hypothetical protein